MAIKEMRNFLKQENKKYTEDFVEMPREQWPEGDWKEVPEKIFRSNKYAAYVYKTGEEDVLRLTIHKTEVIPDVNPPYFKWDDRISWEELQDIKNRCGYDDRDAIEIYPRSVDYMRASDMRHLWLVPLIPFAWRNYQPPKIYKATGPEVYTIEKSRNRS